MCMPLKFLQTLQLVIPLTMDALRPGLHMQSSRDFLTEFRCQCLLASCLIVARCVASSLVMHLTFNHALVL